MKSLIEKFFENTLSIAKGYGFKPAHLATDGINSDSGHSKVRVYGTSFRSGIKRDLSPLLRLYLENNLDIEKAPLLTFHTNIDKETYKAISSTKAKAPPTVTLSVLGVQDAFAEAMLVSASYNILQSFKETPVVQVNSMGEKSTGQKYFDLVKKSLHKNQKAVPKSTLSACRECIVTGHKHLFDEGGEKLHDFLPSTLSVLSENDRIHFQTFLELLDAHKITYSLAPSLIEDPEHCGHSMFMISSKNGNIIARGSRFDSLSNYLYKRPVPVASVSISIPSESITPARYIPKNRRTPTPKVFLFHSGQSARLKVLPLLSMLHENKLPVSHAVYKPRVSDQILHQSPEHRLIIIYGQNEVDRGVVRIRRSDTRSLKEVPVRDLLRTLRMDLNRKA